MCWRRYRNASTETRRPCANVARLPLVIVAAYTAKSAFRQTSIRFVTRVSDRSDALSSSLLRCAPMPFVMALQVCDHSCPTNSFGEQVYSRRLARTGYRVQYQGQVRKAVIKAYAYSRDVLKGTLTSFVAIFINASARLFVCSPIACICACINSVCIRSAS